MAQSTVHFALGLVAGTLLAAPSIYRAWGRDAGLARSLGRGLMLAYGLGLYATLPSILRRFGAYAMWTEAGWVNIFLFYPLIQRLQAPSILLGEILCGALFTLHYSVILFAIRRARRR